MNRLSVVFWLLPEWLFPWLAVGAAAAWILGARRIALSMALLLTGLVVLPPLLAPVIGQLPGWVLWLLSALMVLLLVQGIISAIFGPVVAGHFTAVWLIRVCDFLLLGPFRLIRFLWRGGGGAP